MKSYFADLSGNGRINALTTRTGIVVVGAFLAATAMYADIPPPGTGDFAALLVPGGSVSTDPSTNVILTFKDMGTYSIQVGIDPAHFSTFTVTVLPFDSGYADLRGYLGCEDAVRSEHHRRDRHISDCIRLLDRNRPSEQLYSTREFVLRMGSHGRTGDGRSAGADWATRARRTGLMPGAILTLPATQAASTGFTLLGGSTLSYTGPATNHKVTENVKYYQKQ